MITILFVLLMFPSDLIASNNTDQQTKCILNLVDVDLSPVADHLTYQLDFHIWKKINATENQYIPLTYGNDTQLKEHFGRDRNLIVLYFHDIGGNAQEQWILDSKDYFLRIVPFHICFVISIEYKNLVQEENQAVQNIVPIANVTAKLILWMIDVLPPQFIRIGDITGLGIGALIGAKTMEILHKYTTTRIPCIFAALDPHVIPDALKLPEVCNTEENSLPQIENVQADHVLVMHTSTCSQSSVKACNSSLNVTMGDIDFFINKGRDQPGCAAIDRVCNRKRAAEIYVETWREKLFLRDPIVCCLCNNYEEFEDGTCSCNGWYIMEFYDARIPPGRYYLNTSASPPYV